MATRNPGKVIAAAAAQQAATAASKAAAANPAEHGLRVTRLTPAQVRQALASRQPAKPKADRCSLSSDTLAALRSISWPVPQPFAIDAGEPRLAQRAGKGTVLYGPLAQMFNDNEGCLTVKCVADLYHWCADDEEVSYKNIRDLISRFAQVVGGRFELMADGEIKTGGKISMTDKMRTAAHLVLG